MLTDLIYPLEPEHATARETRYRRAYIDGFLAATEALEDLLHNGQAGAQAVSHLLDHWDGPLDHWVTADCTLVELPPEVG